MNKRRIVSIVIDIILSLMFVFRGEYLLGFCIGIIFFELQAQRWIQDEILRDIIDREINLNRVYAKTYGTHTVNSSSDKM